MNELQARHGREIGAGRLVVGISRQLNNLAMLAITVMMLHITADVACKYLFNAPIDGTLETVALYYMVAVVFLPLAYSCREGGQIMVELFTCKMTERRRLALDGCIGVFGFLYMGVFAWQTLLEALTRTDNGEVRETAESLLAVWPSRWILPIGFGAMAIYLLYEGLQNLRKYRTI